MRRRKNVVPVHGWIVLDKPIGLTSTQALGKVRRILDGDKAGHGGTLDPLATGILPLAFGEATKLIPYIMDGDKEYEFTVRWGEQRDTDDSEGKVIAQSDARPTAETIRAVLPSFTGTIEQVPPIYSALKIDGARAYDIARSGEVLEMKPRLVEIHAFELLDCPDPDTACFRVVCGKGTYIRALARDLAIKLGTYGYIKKLRRTRVGGFTLDKAISLENLTELSHKNAAKTALLALQAALDDIPGLTLTASEAQRLRSGQSILIRPQSIDLINAKLVFAEHQGVPVALVTAKTGAFHVVRGFTF